MIVRVYGDGVHTDVPITPATTCRDLVDCCRDPGEEHCQLVGLSGTHGGEFLAFNLFRWNRVTYVLCLTESSNLG